MASNAKPRSPWGNTKIRPAVPIVMTSGYVRDADRDLALKIGVKELLLKPDTAQALGEVLHRLLKIPQAAAS